MAGVVLEVLFVPQRGETLALLRRAAETMDINLHVCGDPQEVERLLFCHRYDGLIVEHDDQSEDILRALRQSPSSRGAIAIDIHEDDITLQTVFNLGANFELVRPLTVDRIRRTLHLASGLMLLGRRRYYRHPVCIPATLSAGGRELAVTVSNVSEQGVGLYCEGSALTTGHLQCSFDLPDHSGTVVMSTTVVWADKTGQAGCRIDQIVHGREEYVNWVCRLFHQETTSPFVSSIPVAASHVLEMERHP